MNLALGGLRLIDDSSQEAAAEVEVVDDDDLAESLILAVDDAINRHDHSEALGCREHGTS